MRYAAAPVTELHGTSTRSRELPGDLRAPADLRATVLRSCQGDSGCWSEWEMSGTSREGIPSVITGVMIIVSVVDRRIEHTRFYLDAVS
jgi:hypothetical protein